jgi:hypothetical protein
MFFRLHVLAVASCVALAGAAGATEVPEEPLDFTVVRDGEPVGTHIIAFRPVESGTTVEIKTDVAVKLAFITLYRFEHRGLELWRDDRLLSLSSTTNDDGRRHTLDARMGGSAIEVTGDGARSTADASIIPASLWNPALVRQSRLLNTLDGTQMEVTVEDIGEEKISVRGRQTVARHYVVRGALQRELWYDLSGVLARVRFKGRDGSNILYELR